MEALKQCYLIDLRGLKLELDQAGTEASGLVLSPSKDLNRARQILTQFRAEFVLFGNMADQDWATRSLALLASTASAHEELETHSLAGWLRKRAARQDAACLFTVVSASEELLEVAKVLGLGIERPHTFLATWTRRMKAALPAEPQSSDTTDSGRVRIRKGGSGLSTRELDYWKQTFEAGPEQADHERFEEDNPQPPAPQTPDKRDLFERHLGVRPGDGRLMKRDEDDDWLGEDTFER